MHSHFLWSHPAEAKQTNSPANLSEFIHLLNANQNKLVTLNKHQRRVIWNTCFQCTISVWTYPNLYLGFCACMNYLKQGKSEGFDSCDRPSNLKLDSNRQFFPVWPWNLMDDLEKQSGTSSILRQALCIISNPLVNSNWIFSPETLNSVRNWWYVIPCDLETWWMTLKNNRAPLLCHFKLWAAFHSHWWIQTGVTVRKRPIWVKFDNF